MFSWPSSKTMYWSANALAPRLAFYPDNITYHWSHGVVFKMEDCLSLCKLQVKFGRWFSSSAAETPAKFLNRWEKFIEVH